MVGFTSGLVSILYDTYCLLTTDALHVAGASTEHLGQPRSKDIPECSHSQADMPHSEDTLIDTISSNEHPLQHRPAIQTKLLPHNPLSRVTGTIQDKSEDQFFYAAYTPLMYRTTAHPSFRWSEASEDHTDQQYRRTFYGSDRRVKWTTRRMH